MSRATPSANEFLKRHDWRPIREIWPLTDRELRCLVLAAQGKSYKEIAVEMTITPHTVKRHLEHIHEKMHVKTTIQCVTLALCVGLITFEQIFSIAHSIQKLHAAINS